MQATAPGEKKVVYLVRHGDVGYQGRYIGSSDPQLTTIGREQLVGLSCFLKKAELEAVFCSPLRRCRESLQILGVPVPEMICQDLREVDFGVWEGLSYSEILAADEGSFARWAAAGSAFCFPEGESLPAFYQRLTSFWEMLCSRAEHRLLLVTHGGVIRHLLCLALDLPWEKYLSFEIALGSCTVLHVYSGGGVLSGLNLQGDATWRR